MKVTLACYRLDVISGKLQVYNLPVIGIRMDTSEVAVIKR